MKYKGRYLLTIIACVVFFIIIAVLLRFPNTYRERPITIGAILPLSGNVGIFGDWIKNGMELASKGDDNIKIIFEDSQNDPKLGISALSKLLIVNNVDVVVSAMSKVSIPLIPLTEQKRIPLILIDVTYPNITEKGKYLFRHFIQSDREAEILAHFAIVKDLKSTAILYVNDEAGLGANNAFQNTYNKLGRIEKIESYNSTDTDMKAQIAKIINSKVDAIFLFGNGPSWAIALRQIKELGYKGKVLTNTAMFIPNFREIAGPDAIEGVFFTYPYMDITVKSVKNFIGIYQKRYKSFPAIESAYAWDVIKLIQKAFKAKGEDIYDKIRTIKKFSGAFGDIEIPENNDIETKIGIGEIKNGEIINLQVYK